MRSGLLEGVNKYVIKYSDLIESPYFLQVGKNAGNRRFHNEKKKEYFTFTIFLFFVKLFLGPQDNPFRPLYSFYKINGC